MSNYCACSGGDEEYTIELNQQGPEGPQGPVGPEGFSPSISVKTNTDKEYVLTVVNKEGNFDTPNLYGELEKLNADLSNIPNPAVINGVSLSSIEDNVPMITMDSSRITTGVNGNLILNATASNEETMEVFNYEVVANPKEQRLELHDNEGTVKIVATTDEIPNISNLATKEELNTLDTTLSADIATIEANKLEQSNIIAGANITIDRNGNNLTINSTGGGSGDVTAAGDNRFTGDNTFTGKVNIAGGALTVEGLATLNQVTAQYLNAVSITSTGEINATSIKANGLRSDDIQTTENKKYLTEVDIDNQTIQIVNGKLHANIDELGNEVNDLSNRVTTLQASKQDTLTAGANITIVDNVISATGGGGGGVSIDDSTISSASTWSSSKINSEITTVANTKNDNIFDISKFTVVGSPTITDDGVASGFSGNSYLTTPIPNQILGTPDKWTIKTKQYLSITTNVANSILTTEQISTGGKGGILSYIRMNEAGNIYLFFRLYGESETTIVEYITPPKNNLFKNNTLYYFKFEYSKPNFKVTYSEDGINWETCYNQSISSSPYFVGGNIYIGYRILDASSYWNGSIDLNAFKIYVDGEQVFNGLMESTKPIYDKIISTNTALTTFQTDTDNNFSAVNSALNEKANLSDLAGYVTVNKYNELLARVVALETEINGGNA